MEEKIYKLSILCLKIATILSFIVGFFFYINRGIGGGDEWHFINDLKIINEQGWIFAIEKKISIPYMILVYPFSFILPQVAVYRFVNLLLFIGLVIYFYKMGEIKNKLFYFYFLFYSATCWYVTGTNDVVFVVFSIIFFNEVYKIIEQRENYSVSLLLSSLIIVIFTRELYIVFLPVILLSVFLLFKVKVNWLHKIKYPLTIFLFFLIINIPSVVKNHSFSYDFKEVPADVKSTWTQRQYLAQLLVNEGKLADKQHPTWEETDNYLKKNGVNSLPNSQFKSIFFDFGQTCIEFFKNYKDLIQDSVRQEGIILIVVLCYLFYFLLKNKKLVLNLYLPLIIFVMCSVFAFIIFSYIETRWLIAIFIMALIYYSDLEYYNKLSRKILIFNNFLICAIVVYGFYKISLKIG
jgi:hypothetical protein